MSLVDPKETRVLISGTWKPTAQEVKEIFERSGLFVVIEESLKNDENQKHFEECFKKSFDQFTDKSLEKTTRINFMWLLNSFALKEDVKTNTAIYISMRIADKKQLISEDKVREILKVEGFIKDIIYDLKETLTVDLKECLANPREITALRVKKARSSRVLLSNKIKTEII